MTNYAFIDSRIAYLKEDFGEELARRWFGDERIDAMPRYVKGKHKGKLKGVVTWKKIVRGGWVKTWDGEGYVETRVGHIFDRKLHELYSDQNGTGPGKCVYDLDSELYKAEARARWIETVKTDLEALKSDRQHYVNSKDGLSKENAEIIDSIISDVDLQIGKLEKELM